MVPYQEYEKAGEEARRAFIDQNFRLAADKYWKAIRIAPAGVWTETRVLCMQCYVRCLEEGLIVPTKKDYKRLETHIVNNDEEPNIFRAKAALCLGLMYFNDNKKDYEEAAECVRHCIDLCDNASPEEKERVDIVMLVLANEPPRARQLSEVFDEIKANALGILRQLERCDELEVGVHDPVRSPGCVFPRAMLVPIFGDIPTQHMERRMACGGATCDCCGVARGSTDLKRLLVCGKCKMAYYCSQECQLEQWKRGGHKKACRKPREFLPDDIVRCVWEDKACMMRLRRLVDGEDGDGTRRWEACFTTVDGELLVDVVAESTLSHIRPADIV